MKHVEYACNTEKIKAGAIYPTNFNGDIQIVEYIHATNVIVKFLDCKHQHKVKTTTYYIKKGVVKNPYRRTLFGVGYIGVGKYSTKGSPEEKAAYGCWSDMIRRCYYERELIRYPTYRGCSVCPEWQCFQVFAEWYINHPFFGLGYHLDKDVLVRGNKVYSPSTCTLLPESLNIMLCDSRAARGKYPVGVSWHKRDENFSCNARIGSKPKYLGNFATAEEASAKYVIYKEAFVKESANAWRGRIEEKAYEAFMDWTVY